MDARLERRAALALLGGLLLAACGETRVGKVYGPGDEVVLSIQGKDGPRKLEVELAIDGPSRTRGLMFRKDLPEDRGMLFIWPQADRLGIWMKNTPLPLSVAFLSDQGEILQIEDLRPHDERPVRSKDDVRYALEVNRGWFERKGIAPGAVFEDFPKMAGLARPR